MDTIALTMIVKNEQKCLARCLKSVQDIVDEIVIVDTGSSDDTKKIAASFGVSIYDYAWANDFSAARNFAMERTSCKWCLVLDADEYVVSGGKQDVLTALHRQNGIGAIEIRSFFIDDGERGCSSMWGRRILPHNARWSGKIHEQVDSNMPTIKVPLVVEHDGYLLKEQEKGNRNLNLLKEELSRFPQKPYLLYQTAHTLRILKRYQEADTYFRAFYRNVPCDAHYREDGIISYLYNILELKQFQSGLQIIRAEQTCLRDSADFQFLCGVFYMQLVLFDTKTYISYLPQIENAYLKCLEIGKAGESIQGTGSFKASYNLGTWYEVSGNRPKAVECYRKAFKQGYALAEKRLAALGEL